jgi:hypothetical protein
MCLGQEVHLGHPPALSPAILISPPNPSASQLLSQPSASERPLPFSRPCR